MRSFLARWGFVGLSATIMVFFSEKVFWYPQGYAIVELILYYAIPTAACLWLIEIFHVRNLSEVVLVGALYAFLVEGVLTPVIYEAGLTDPVMPVYFIGWHGLLSFVIGWYSFRRWLVRGAWGRLLAASALVGLFWGIWSITYWLPVNIAEWEHLAAIGEAVSGDTLWTTPQFALYAFGFTLLMAVSHGLLGRGGWQRHFKPGAVEGGFVVIALVVIFTLQVFFILPFAILKLVGMIGAVLLPLVMHRRRNGENSVFKDLVGSVHSTHLLGLFLMPLAATVVYGMAGILQPSEPIIGTISEVFPALQIFLGGVIFLWAWIVTLRPFGRSDVAARSDIG